jgi:hypothetical protein
MLRLFISCGLCLAALILIWAAPARALQAQATGSPTPEASAPAAGATSGPTAATEARQKTAAILSPVPGQALQGSAPIVVDTAVEGFEAAELAFAYANNPSGTWFTLFQSNQPVSGEALMEWDTSQISDGTYTLRLTVRLSDGTQQEVEAAGLRVRNYTAIENDTPTPVTPSATSPPQDTPVPSFTPTPTGTPRPPTPTPLPDNPAVLDKSEVVKSAAKGALVVLGIFALAALYGALRRFGR